jgi:hypothetical protein
MRGKKDETLELHIVLECGGECHILLGFDFILLWKERLSSDVLSCSMAAISIQKAENQSDHQ